MRGHGHPHQPGDVAGALSISGSTLSIRSENIPQYAELLSRACNALSPYARMMPAILYQNQNIL